MLRLRIAGGKLTKDKLKYIIDCSEKYSIDCVKITTCQSIQLHNIEPKYLGGIVEGAWKSGMITRGAGGDHPRNVMSSPLSGVEKSENFDVLPYALETSDYLLGQIKKIKLPRKLKVSFTNSKLNDTHSTFRDIGFSSNKDGTFDVYIAGGLGNQPKLGILIAKSIEPNKILYYVSAMIKTFVTYGDYKNRNKSRTRFLQDTLGIEGLKDAYSEKLKESFEENLDVKIKTIPVSKTGEKKRFRNTRIKAQKQEGLFSVHYHPIGGKINLEKLKEIYNLILDMQEVEIRLTTKGGLYIINCDHDEVKKVIQVTKDSAVTLFENSVACIGSSICQIGILDSQTLLKKCVMEVKKENFAAEVLPTVYISGCPSSCGMHQVSEIGFRGAMKKIDGELKEACTIFVGGCEYRGAEKLGEIKKAFLAENIPSFLIELGRKIASQNTTFKKWIKKNEEELSLLIEKYAQ